MPSFIFRFGNHVLHFICLLSTSYTAVHMIIVDALALYLIVAAFRYFTNQNARRAEVIHKSPRPIRYTAEVTFITLRAMSSSHIEQSALCCRRQGVAVAYEH